MRVLTWACVLATVGVLSLGAISLTAAPTFAANDKTAPHDSSAIGNKQAVKSRPAAKGKPIVQGKSGRGLVTFALPDSPGHVISPNALNYALRGRAGGPLLLFLPATRAIPADYRDFLGAASSLGFHVLALDYWNRGLSVVKTCRGIPDCYTSVQQNRFDGTAPSIYSAIHPDDSIINRVRMALTYLRHSDPTGSWARYATGSHIHWNRIVLAGHSQGGGQSAFISHEHRVRGVLMFSSPVESDDGIAASWMSTPGRTPSRLMYGFVSSNDVYYRNVVASWANMGMGSPVDSAALLTDRHAHSITSSIHLGSPGKSHSRSVTDSTPRNSSGIPLFEPIWTWMLERVR